MNPAAMAWCRHIAYDIITSYGKHPSYDDLVKETNLFFRSDDEFSALDLAGSYEYVNYLIQNSNVVIEMPNLYY